MSTRSILVAALPWPHNWSKPAKSNEKVVMETTLHFKKQTKEKHLKCWKAFDALIRWFLTQIHIEVCWKWKDFFHSDMSADVTHGVTWPVHWPVRIELFVWTEEKTESWWQVIKENQTEQQFCTASDVEMQIYGIYVPTVGSGETSLNQKYYYCT